MYGRGGVPYPQSQLYYRHTVFENHKDVNCRGNGCLKQEAARVYENSELQQISAESSTGKERRAAPI